MLTVQTLRRLEVWSNLACAGGARLVVVRDATSIIASVKLVGISQLTVVLPLTSAAMASIAEGKVFRVDESDTSFDEWRISDVEQDTTTGLATITAMPIEQELGTRGEVVKLVDGLGITYHNIDVVGLTPTQIITNYLTPALTAAGISWASIGTITPTWPVDVTIAWDTPLAVLTRLATLTTMEFQLRRNGTTGYLIDLIAAVGSSAPVADVRYRKNLAPGVKQVRTSQSQMTRCYPRGAEVDGVHGTMARARWKVTNIAGSVITLADFVGGDGPIAFDGQLAGANGTVQAYLRTIGGTLTQVTASSKSAQTVTVASATGIAVGDRVQFRADSAGHDLTWLDSPADRATYGLVVGVSDQPNVPATINLLLNPATRDWPSGTLPPNYTLLGGTTTSAKETTITDLGGQSIKVVTLGDGAGVETALVPLDDLSSGNKYVSGFAHVYVQTGQVRVELVAQKADLSFVTYPAVTTPASSSGTGVFLDLGAAGIDLQALPAVNVKLRIVQHGAVNSTFFVDATQVTVTSTQQPFVEGAGATQLWQAANDVLRLSGGPVVTYDAQLADLARLNSSVFGTDCAFVIGGTVRVTDARAAIAITTRVVGIDRDYQSLGQTRLTFSTNADDLTGTFARPAAPARKTHPTPVTQPSTGSGSPASESGATLQATIELTSVASPLAPTVQLNGSVGAAGVGPLEYRYRVVDPNATWSEASGWTGYQQAPTLPITVAVPLSFAVSRQVILEVRDAGTTNLATKRTTLNIGINFPAIDTGTGNVDPNQPVAGGTRPIASTAYVDNEDFDSWLLGLPTSWIKTSGGTVVRDTSIVFSGSASLKYTPSAGSGLRGIVTKRLFGTQFTVPMQPGKTYRLLVAARASGITGTSMRAKLTYDAARTLTATKDWTFAAINTWQVNEWILQVPATAEAKSELQLLFDQGAGAINFWLDHVAIEAGVPTIAAIDANGNVVKLGNTSIPVGTTIASNGTLQATGTTQFGGTGVGDGKRVELDTGGNVVVRQLSTGVDGTKLVAGDYSVINTTLLTSKSDTQINTIAESVSAFGNNATATSTAASGTPATPADYPAYDGKYTVAFVMSCTASGSDNFGTPAIGYSYALLSYSLDGGTTYSTPVSIASVSAQTGTPSGNKSFGVKVSIAGAGATFGIRFRLAVQAQSDAFASASTASTITGGTITWKKASGTVLARRALYIASESAQPHMTLDPLTGTEPDITNSVEGEAWYSGTSHALRVHDGNQIATFKRYEMNGLLNDFANSTVTFTDVTFFSWLVGAGETWVVELEGHAAGGTSGCVVRVAVTTTYTLICSQLANTTAVGTLASDYITTGDPAARCTSITGYIKQSWKLVVGATAGTMKVQFKSGAAVASTLKAGFTVRAYRIG